MKKLIILAKLFALVNIANAQWSANGFDIYKDPNQTGKVGIGISSPMKQLHLANTGDATIRLHSFAGLGPQWDLISSGGNNQVYTNHFAIVDARQNNANRFDIDPSGNIGIGTTTSYARLHVAVPNGIGLEIDHNNSSSPYEMAAIIKVNHDLSRPLYVEKSGACIFQVWGTGVVNAKALYAESVTVMLGAIGQAWPDYVFKKNYKLMSLSSLEQFIEKNNHLPNVPSEQEINKKGANLGELVRVQMEKLEELTLYIIQLKKEIDAVKKSNN